MNSKDSLCPLFDHVKNEFFLYISHDALFASHSHLKPYNFLNSSLLIFESNREVINTSISPVGKGTATKRTVIVSGKPSA